MPGLVPPILLGLLVLGVHRIARQEMGSSAALAAAVWVAVSPFFVANAATLLSFTTVACAAVWCVAALAEADRTHRRAWNLAAGALLGLVAITRPYDALALGLAVASPLALRLHRRETAGGATADLAVISLGALPLVCGLLLFNQLTLGGPFHFAYTHGIYQFGFWVHPVPGFEYFHTPIQAVGNLTTGLIRLDGWLLGWPGATLLCWAGAFTHVRSRADLTGRLAVASHVLLYFVVLNTGTWDVGPTYYLAVAPWMVLLAVRGLRAMATTLVGPAFLPAALQALFIVGPIAAWLTVVPLRALRLGTLAHEANAPWHAVAASGVGDAILVVPYGAQMGAAGYALGYPYEIRTGPRTRVRVCRPRSSQELLEARAWLGPELPVYALHLDRTSLDRGGVRRYTLLRLDAPSPPVTN